jgi:hypothetical protein
MKLLAGLAGGLFVGGAMATIVQDPGAMAAIGSALQTMDPEAGALAASAIGAGFNWSTYAGTLVIVILVSQRKAIGSFLEGMNERHHARLIRKHQLEQYIAMARGAGPPPPQYIPRAEQ